MLLAVHVIGWKYVGTAVGAFSTVYGVTKTFVLGATVETYLAAGGGMSLLGLVAWKVLTDRSTEERMRQMFADELEEERRKVEQLEAWSAEMIREMAAEGIIPPERPPLPPKDDG